jgi:2-hydroxy-6-oxonona-2,4-dienedioate hydrolase
MAQDRTVTVAGLKTRYLEQGSGPVALLLHGAALGTSADVWAGNIGPLAHAGLRVIAPDLPGWGLTDAPSDHSYGFRRRFVLNFLDALEIEKAAFIGHSASGRIAVETAFTDTGRVNRIMVLGSGTLLPPMEGVPMGPPDDRVSGEPTLEDTRAGLLANTCDQSLITDELVELRHRMSLGKNLQSALARQSLPPEPPPQPPFWQRLDQIPVPARFLYGKQDRGEAGKRSELARQRYPKLDLHVLDGCKHLIQWDTAREFEALAVEFLLERAPAAA